MILLCSVALLLPSSKKILLCPYLTASLLTCFMWGLHITTHKNIKTLFSDVTSVLIESWQICHSSRRKVMFPCDVESSTVILFEPWCAAYLGQPSLRMEPPAANLGATSWKAKQQKPFIHLFLSSDTSAQTTNKVYSPEF